MNGYLVLARCGIDDIPIGLFSGRKRAVAAAKGMTAADVKRIALKTYGLDVSVIFGIDVVEFADGLPVGTTPHEERGCLNDFAGVN